MYFAIISKKGASNVYQDELSSSFYIRPRCMCALFAYDRSRHDESRATFLLYSGFSRISYLNISCHLNTWLLHAQCVLDLDIDSENILSSYIIVSIINSLVQRATALGPGAKLPTLSICTRRAQTKKSNVDGRFPLTNSYCAMQEKNCNACFGHAVFVVGFDTAKVQDVCTYTSAFTAPNINHRAARERVPRGCRSAPNRKGAAPAASRLYAAARPRRTAMTLH